MTTMKASYRVYKSHLGDWVCMFYLGTQLNNDHRGTSGTGCKLYETEAKAEAAGKYYLKTMKKNGFEI